MDKNKLPEKLAIDISYRSSCSVRVGSVIIDKKGRLVSWGHNHMGFDGFGCCAERSAVLRSNRKRLPGSSIYVAGFRARNNNPVTSKPCPDCQRLIRWAGIKQAHYFTKEKDWMELYA